MAISWGPFENGVRLGIAVAQSPTSIGVSTMQVAMDLELWIQMDGYSTMWGPANIVFTGAWSGSTTQPVNLGQNGVARLWKTTGYYPTYTAAYNLVWGATVAHPKGSSYRGVSWPVPARPVAPPPKPNAPTGLSVGRSSDTRHTVSWNRTSTYTSVVVQRQENDGAWKQVGKPSGNAASWVDTTTKANRKYRYRVAGISAGGQSSWSGLSAVVYTTAAAPSSVSAVRSGSNIRVTPNGLPAYATHFDVEDNGTVIASAVTRAALPYTHSGPSTSVTHRYRVRSRVASGGSVSSTLYSAWSPYSGVVQLTAPPNAPTKLSPNGAYLNESALLSVFAWQHNPTDSSDEVQYQIRWRNAGDTAWIERAVSNSNVASVLPTGIFSGDGSYEWQVRTRGEHLTFSPWSATATFELVSPPEVSISHPESVWDRPELTLGWDYFQGAGRPQSAWQVQVLNSDSDVIETASGNGSTDTYPLTTRLLDGASYTVRVRAAAGTIWSAWAEQVVAVVFVPPLPPVFSGSWVEDAGVATLSIGRGLRDEGPDFTNVYTNPSFENALALPPGGVQSNEWSASGRFSLCVIPDPPYPGDDVFPSLDLYPGA